MEWKSGDEYPEKDGIYLCITMQFKADSIRTMEFRRFQRYGRVSKKEVKNKWGNQPRYQVEILYWAEIPNLPKDIEDKSIFLDGWFYRQ